MPLMDAQPSVQKASSFQEWVRNGPDKQLFCGLGIFYLDNVSDKRGVFEAGDPKTRQGVNAVFVTVEPNGASQHPTGKQWLPICA